MKHLKLLFGYLSGDEHSNAAAEYDIIVIVQQGGHSFHDEDSYA